MGRTGLALSRFVAATEMVKGAMLKGEQRGSDSQGRLGSSVHRQSEMGIVVNVSPSTECLSTTAMRDTSLARLNLMYRCLVVAVQVLTASNQKSMHDIPHWQD